MLVVGLGNPGDEYGLTRHNLGFLVVDELARRGRVLRDWRKLCRSVAATVSFAGRELLLAKPQTYMNLSGVAVECLLRTFKLEPAGLLVVCDDVSLPLGALRLRPSGGDGGHNGLKDIIARLGQGFGRLRVGCGPAPRYADLADYVLSPFAEAERETLGEALERAAKGCALLDRIGYQRAMAEVNRRLDAESDEKPADNGGDGTDAKTKDRPPDES